MNESNQITRAGHLEQLTQQLIQTSGGQPIGCLFLGGTDTGKTTLVTHLAERLVGQRTVAIIDADVGQSHIGPPATIGWALAEPLVADLSELALRQMYFVGDTSPSGHLLPFTVALIKAHEQASRQAQLVLIDTGGLIIDPAARALWWQICQAIRPGVVVAVQRHSELEPLLLGIEKTIPRTWHLACPEHVQIKSAAERQRFRTQRFAEYFNNASVHELDLRNVSCQAVRGPGRTDSQDVPGRLLALRNDEGTDLVLGVGIERPTISDTLRFYSPTLAMEKIRCVVLGDVHIDLTVLKDSLSA